MASQRTRFTTEEVLAYFRSDDLSNDEVESSEETLDEFVGLVLPDTDESNTDDDSENSEKRGEPKSCSDLSESEDIRRISSSSTSARDSTNPISDVVDLPPLSDMPQDVPTSSSEGVHTSVNPYDSSDTNEESSDDESLESSEPISSTEESSEEESTISISESSEIQSRKRSTFGDRRGAKRPRGAIRGRGTHSRGASRTPTTRASYKNFLPENAKPISETDTDCTDWNRDFLPLREPGPQLPVDQSTSELDLLRLFITDEMLDRFVAATNAYAESKKGVKRAMYIRFKRTPLTREELLRFLGVLLLLSINSVKNFRKAWERKSSQVLVRLLDLMPRSRFKAINSFFHVVTPQEESATPNDPLKKVRPFYEDMKKRCQQFYQPLKELSVDERMVKSKARTHFRQYIRNKPTKWGFKYWVLADPTGYTLDFNLYCGRHQGSPISSKGLAFDVVMELANTYRFQSYSMYFDNLYTSPALVHALKEAGIGATGTLRTNRKDVPTSVHHLMNALKRSDVPRGTGYYIRQDDDVYVCWRDNTCVCVMSNDFPGHSDGTVRRRGRTQNGQFEIAEVPLPSAIKNYNKFMGGVDLSDQLISYHRVIRQTKRYWRTIFYHLLEIAITNASIIHKWIQMEAGKKAHTTGNFRDAIVLDIMTKFGTTSSGSSAMGDFVIRHGSIALSGERRKCALCHSSCGRQCPDCPFSPALCQSNKKDCHGVWHSHASAATRSYWFARKTRKVQSAKATKPKGRPKGSKKKRRSRVK